MSSIKFDSTEICNGTYIPRYVKHESAPLRELSLLELAGEDGAVLVSEKYGVKHIILTGKLTAASRSALDTAIDNFKELFSRKEKDLDIEWEAGTRRYVATCVRHNFNRDFFHNLFVPWIAEFVVAKGIGEATSETHQVNNQSFTAASYASSVTFAGSAKPKPRIRVKCGVSATDPKGLSIENTDTDEKIVITRSSGFGTNKYFEVDCRNKTVKYDGVERAFYGVFPSWKIGSNAYEIKIGNIYNQEFNPTTGVDNRFAIYDDGVNDVRAAQSFTVPNKDTTFQGIDANVKRQGAVGADLFWRIETDNNGKPSGTPVANANGSIAEVTVSTAFDAWKRFNSANAFTLNANTRYWLVLYTTSGDSSNNYFWSYASGINATYKKGNANTSNDAGTTWTNYTANDMLFRILYGGKGDAAKTYYFDIYYYKRFL